MPKHHHIRRTDNAANNTHGWLVRVERKGERESKFFSDSVHGGKKKSLEIALNHRDFILGLSPKGYSAWRRSILRKNNTSGVPGVGRYLKIQRNPDSAYWCAFWNDVEGIRRTRQFKVNQHGEDQARALAVDERVKQLRLLGDAD